MQLTIRLLEFVQKSEDTTASDYAEWASSLSSLVSLHLITSDVDNVNDDCLNKLSAILLQCVKLEKFVSQYGFIGCKTGINYGSLFNALQRISTLSSFDIFGNHVGHLKEDDLESLSSFIKSSNLKYINLAWNDLEKLTDDNFRKLFISIQESEKLEELNLTLNDFSSISQNKFEVLCSCLSGCPKLLRFYINTDHVATTRKQRLCDIKCRLEAKKSQQHIQPLTPSILKQVTINLEEPVETQHTPLEITTVSEEVVPTSTVVAACKQNRFSRKCLIM